MGYKRTRICSGVKIMTFEQMLTIAEAHIRIVDRWFEVDN